MEITWLGQACFRIKSTRGIVITDPYPPDMGYTLGKQTAKIVTVSHQHPDHAYSQGINGEFRVISRPGEYEVSNILVIGISTYHDNEHGQTHGKNIVYLIQADDISVCHLGDLGQVLTSSQVETLEPVDVLLVPVGGVTTIDAKKAAEVVRQLEPKIVIPMHYKTPALTGTHFEFDTADRFLAEFGATGLTPQPKLNITKTSAPDAMQIVVLDYPHITLETDQ